MPHNTRFETVKSYTRKLMLEKLDSRLKYHSIAHTFDDVLPATERIARLEGIGAGDLEILQTAAIFHDIGFIQQREKHEETSIAMAREILPDYSFDEHEINSVAIMIQATQIPQSPQTHLAKILADADLDVLGREDFATRNQDLRDELEAFGQSVTDEAWFGGQIKFLKTHHYFTSAQRIHDHQKQRNIQYLENRLKLAIEDGKA